MQVTLVPSITWSPSASCSPSPAPRLCAGEAGGSHEALCPASQGSRGSGSGELLDARGVCWDSWVLPGRSWGVLATPLCSWCSCGFWVVLDGLGWSWVALGGPGYSLLGLLGAPGALGGPGPKGASCGSWGLGARASREPRGSWAPWGARGRWGPRGLGLGILLIVLLGGPGLLGMGVPWVLGLPGNVPGCVPGCVPGSIADAP